MRIITRGDLDGLTCAVLIKEMEDVSEVVFVHPRDLQDGKVEVKEGDVIANLPYDPRCEMWFDHHVSEEQRVQPPDDLRGAHGEAPSAARLIYDYYDDEKLKRFERLVEETDRMDSAKLNVDDVVDPQGYVLLFYTIDPRTGLGQFQEYFNRLVELIRTQPVDQVLDDPEVKERSQKILAEQDQFAAFLKENSRLEDNVVITDIRGKKDAPRGNRFLIYTLFPDCNVSLRIFDGKGGQNLVGAIGHNIFNRTCKTNVGELCAEYGGGGHVGAGTVQFGHDEAEAKFAEIIGKMKAAG
jgi:oligoribonuclease NrnB/cAMP/cGMP phosphodiesterase (DHH superfamily)